VVDDTWVGLAEAIGELRRELESALTSAAEPRIRFELGPVELEFTVDFKNTGGVDGGIRWGVVSFGAKGEHAAQHGNRLKLVLQPKDTTTGRKAEVTASRPELPPVD
jgi:hypothetical protein